MTKLALSDEILMKIDKPARYIGNELNSIKKDKEKVAIRFAMCFPDVYEIGMSHLGVQILYDMFNKMEDVWCERVYSPWPDLHKIMKEAHIPLFGLESQCHCLIISNPCSIRDMRCYFKFTFSQAFNNNRLLIFRDRYLFQSFRNIPLIIIWKSCGHCLNCHLIPN